MKYHVLKNPSPCKLAICREAADDASPEIGWEEMTIEAFNLWKDEQISNGWVAPCPQYTEAKRQSARVVLNRLTDVEYVALTTCSNISIQRGLESARIEGIISTEDPDFQAFVDGCDSLGIIVASRWDDLLA